MKKVTIHQAKTNLSKLLLGVAAGEEVIIARGGKAIAKLIPIEREKKQRRPGLYANQIEIGRDFENPLPTSVMKHFKG